MDLRKKELLDLKSFTQYVDTEVTMLLQSIQWDRKRLLEGASTAICRYDANHRVPKKALGAHENSCMLRSLGYTETDQLLPDPPDDGAHTLVKFSNNDIQQIINEAASTDPLFKKGVVDHQPLSLSRLQLVYTADERRALHDAVVAAVPSCHDLGDLALASSNEDEKQGNVVKSRTEILAELRNMKRRRTKYRVAAKTRNYSDVLRDVIKTQMESYSEAVASTLSRKADDSLHNQSKYSDYNKTQARSNFSANKDGKHESVRSRDHNEGRHDVTPTRKGTHDAHYKENRQTEVKIRKESSIKRYEKEYDRSESRMRDESPRDRSRNRNKEHDVEKSTERYKSGSEYYESKRAVSSYKHKINIGEDSIHGHGHKIDAKYYKSEKNKEERKRKTYDYDERHSERRYYKEDKYSKVKIKEEPKDQSRESSANRSHQTDKRRSGRSRSRERHRDNRQRKRVDEDYRKYGEQHEETHYKRYYDVKKENS